MVSRVGERDIDILQTRIVVLTFRTKDDARAETFKLGRIALAPPWPEGVQVGL
jgi:hypothetical protein